jgi:hypothetical protein
MFACEPNQIRRISSPRWLSKAGASTNGKNGPTSIRAEAAMISRIMAGLADPRSSRALAVRAAWS